MKLFSKYYNGGIHNTQANSMVNYFHLCENCHCDEVSSMKLLLLNIQNIQKQKQTITECLV